MYVTCLMYVTEMAYEVGMTCHEGDRGRQDERLYLGVTTFW